MKSSCRVCALMFSWHRSGSLGWNCGWRHIPCPNISNRSKYLGKCRQGILLNLKSRHSGFCPLVYARQNRLFCWKINGGSMANNCKQARWVQGLVRLRDWECSQIIPMFRKITCHSHFHKYLNGKAYNPAIPLLNWWLIRWVNQWLDFVLLPNDSGCLIYQQTFYRPQLGDKSWLDTIHCSSIFLATNAGNSYLTFPD